MKIQKSIKSAIQTIARVLSLALILSWSTQSFGQIDTLYIDVEKSDSLLLIVDTSAYTGVDVISACHEGANYGSYALNNDSLTYKSSTIYGRDTLCTIVDFVGGEMDTSIYVITVLPSVEMVIDSMFQNSTISIANSGFELQNLDSVALCSDIFYGSLSIDAAPVYDYTSGYVSAVEDGCIVGYGDDGVTDTLYFAISIQGLEVPAFDIGEWYIDVDPGLGNGNIFPLAGDTLAMVDINIPLDNISNGLHTLFFRVKNDNGLWGFAQSKIFFKQIGTGQAGLAKAEWFLDEDPGLNNGNSLTLSGDTAVVDFNIDLSNVSNGLHTLYVRAQDGLGYWSVKQSHLFFKQQGGGINDVAQMEYYIDVDPGYGNGNFLPSSNNAEVDVTFNVDIDDLPAGLHTLYVRAKNEQNYWSFSGAHTFFKVFGVSDSPEIVSLEYYLDQDPGLGNGIAINIPQTDSIDYVVNVDLDGLSTGIHSVSFRGMSSNGFWSHVQSHTFFVVQGNSLDKQITQLEYFYNIDPGYGNALPISITPNDTIDITAPLSLSGLPVGDHDLYIRAKDDNELWSIIYQESVEVTESDSLFAEIAFVPAGVSIMAEDCYNEVTSDFYIKNTGESPLTFSIDDQTSWLSYSQELGSIQPDDSLMITITANPQGLLSAQQLVDVTINSNDAISPDTTYSVVFNIPQSALSIELSRDTINFDDTQVFTSNTEILSILNSSCTDINIDSIKIDLADFTVSITDTLILEGESINIDITVMPIVDGMVSEPMYVYSDAGTDTVILQVLGLEIPSISYSEDTISFDFVSCAQSDMFDFQVYNNGQGPLFFDIDLINLPSWFEIQPSVDTVSAGDSTLLTIILTDPELANGAYSYDIPFSSNDPNTPISILPMIISVDGSSEIASNVSTIQPETIPRNTTNTTTIDLQNIGCDNLSITSVSFGTTVFETNVTSVFLPPYYNYPVNVTFSPPYAGTFIDTMTVISDAGMFKIPTTAIASGAFTQEVTPLALIRTIQACDGMTMDTIIVKNSGDGEGTWEITNINTIPGWLYISTITDTLDQGDSTIVEIGFDATGLINANYDALIQFQFSDPITPAVFVPVDMYVEGAAVVNLDKDTIDFGYTYFTTYKTDTITLANVGCDTLHVLGVDRNTQYTVSDSIFDVLPNDSFDVVITYDPNEINLHDDTLTFEASTDTLSVIILAEGVDIPRITTLNKDSLVVTMPKDIDATSLTDSTWVVWGDQTGRRFGTYSVQNGNEMVFEPGMEFRAGEEVSNSLNGIVSNSNELLTKFGLTLNAPVNNVTSGSFNLIPTSVIGDDNDLATMIFADFNSDENIDILKVESNGSYDLQILFNDGNANFTSGIIYDFVNTQYYPVSTPDFNNDGFPDLLIDLHGSPASLVIINNGDGTFSSAQTISESRAYPIDEDLNLDGLKDIQAHFNNVLTGHINNGDTGFLVYDQFSILTPSGFTMSDFNSDGFSDVLLINNGSQDYLQLLANKSDLASFQLLQSEITLNQSSIMKSEDLNSDGIIDVILNEISDTKIILSEENEFPSVNNKEIIYPQKAKMVFGDLDGDNKRDIFIVDRFDGNNWGDQTIEVLLNNENTTFLAKDRSWLFGESLSTNLADLDNDGDLDFAFLDEDGRLWLAINEDSNAEMALSQDTIQDVFSTCSIDTTYSIEIYNNGDSTLIWQVAQVLPSGGQGAGAGAGNLPNWLTIDTTYGQIPGGDSLSFDVHINSEGLPTGNYAYNLVWNTNDTTSYHDTLHISFTLESDSLVTISAMNLDYGLVDTMSMISLDLRLKNFGCDTLDVAGMFESGLVFSSTSLPSQLYPFDSLDITVDLDAVEIIGYNDTLTIDFEYDSYSIPLTATGCYTIPVTEIFEQVCDVDSVGVDSLMLINVSGCDSLVVTNYYLPELETCPELTGYISKGNFQGHCYYESTSSYVMSTIDANIENLLNENNLIGNLLVIESQVENDWIQSDFFEDVYYIGLRDGNGTGDSPPCESATSSNKNVKCWLWDDGRSLEQVGFSNWNGAEPNNHSNNEDYTNIYGGGHPTVAARGKWNDLIGNNSYKHILEIIGAQDVPSISYVQSCFADSVGIDTTILANANQFGCDSTIIEVTSLQTPISPEGLVAYYPFDGNVEDMSGYENDGVVNGASLSEDRFGTINSAYSFDGNDDYNNLDNIIEYINGIDEFSFSTWFKSTDNPSQDNQNMILCANDELPSTANILRFGTAVNGGIFYSPSDGTHYVAGVSYNDGEWHNLAVRIGNSVIDIFVDGILLETRNNFNVDWHTIGKLSLGQDYDNNILTDFFNGQLDEVFFITRSITDYEIQKLYLKGPISNKTEISSCDISVVGNDTTLLTNQYGCDSTIIEVTSLQTPISPEGLVAYYPFDGNAEDMSGYENDGVVNGATLTEDRFGNVAGAYRFDGVNDYIDVPHSNQYDFQEFTINAWVLDEDDRDDQMICLKGRWNTGEQKREFEFRSNLDNGAYFDIIQGGIRTDSDVWSHNYGPENINIFGEWKMVTFSFDGNSSKLFMNGQLISEKIDNHSLFKPNNPQSLLIGAGFGSNAQDYRFGKLDEFLIYNRPLTESEIQQLYLHSKTPNTTLTTQDTLLDFGTIDIGDTTSLQTFITNATCDTIYPMISNEVDKFTFAVTSDTIMPYQSVAVDIQFTTDSIAVYEDTLSVFVEGDTLYIPMSAMAIGNAEIVLSAMEYSDTSYMCDEVLVDSFYISNIGTDPLNYVILSSNYVLSAVPMNGSVPVGDSTWVTFTYDASGLINGSYIDSLTITSDDATDPEVYFHIDYVLDGTAEKSVSTDLLEFGNLVAGDALTLSFDINNAGCDSILISSISNTEPEFAFSVSEYNVPPFDTRLVSVTYTSTSQMMVTDTLIIDTDYGIDTVILMASACEPSPTAYLITDICDEVLVSSDTSFFTNQYGCDSLIVNNSLLPTVVDDSQSEIVLLFDQNANDSSPNGYNASLTGATYGIDRLGNANSAIACDGFFDYATTTGASSVTLDTSNFSLSVWFKTNATEQQTIVSKTNIGAENYLSLSINNGQVTFELADPTNTQSVTSSMSSLADDEWHHLLATRNDAGRHLYVDGALDASQAYTLPIDLDASGEFHLGILQSWTDGTLSQSFDGSIDNFRLIYGIPSQQNIDRLYAEDQDHINTTTLYSQVCDIDSVGVDTAFFTNTYGCDSLVVTYYELPNAAPTNGLVAYYPFNGNADDESGNGNDATPQNNPSYGLGPYGNYVKINGSGHTGANGKHVLLPNLNLDDLEEFSVSIWVRDLGNTSHLNHSEHYIAFGTNTQSDLGIGYDPINDNIFYRLAGTAIVQPFSEQLDSWNHYVMTYNGITMTCYQNGMLLSAKPRSNDFDLGSQAGIGRHWWNDGTSTSTRLIAEVDEVRIYSKALTEGEISTLYYSGSNETQTVTLSQSCTPLQVGTDTTLLTNQYGCDSTIIEVTSLQTPISPEGLVAYYPFDGNADDMSGYENDGVVNGATLTEDRFGNVDGAYSFDGVKSISIQDSEYNDSDRRISISLWIRPELGGSATNYFLNKWYAGAINGDYQIGLQNQMNGSYKISCGVANYPEYGGSGSSFMMSNNSFNYSEWSNVTMTFDEGTIDLYVNGTLEFTINSIIDFIDTNDYLNDDIYLGNVYNNLSQHNYNGDIDDLILFNRALTPTEIQLLYLQSKAPNTTLTTQDTLLDFGTITKNDTTSLNTFITNATCDTVEIDNISTTQSVFWTEESALTLLPYQSAEVEVYFRPTASVPYAGQLIYSSIDSDTLYVELQGGGCDLCACPTENIVIHNQQEVDDYIAEYGGCDTINVNFTIDETSSITDIIGLDFLSQIDGNLVIKNTTAITDLSGFANLQDVTGSVAIQDNNVLTALTGLNRLKQTGFFTITDNNGLTTVNGIDSLTIVTGNLTVTNNATLTDCAPLCALLELLPSGQGQSTQGVSGTTTISGNPAECSTLNEVQIRCTDGCPQGDFVLTTQAEVNAFAETFSTLSGAEGCDSIIGNLTIDGDDISDLTGLLFIQVITGTLTLKNNPSLTSVSGLQNLSTVGNRFIIENNAVVDIDSLSALASVMSNMTIRNNAALQNVNGLTSVGFVEGNLIVTNNQSLTDCSGLCTILDLPPLGSGQTNQGISGSITIAGNPSECSSLTEVTIRCNEGSCPDFDVTLRNQIEVDAYVATFNQCDSIFGSLTIQGGNSIQDITGLSFIQYVGGSLIFKNNYDLDSISGLDSVQYVGGDFKIENNHELQDISQMMMLTHIGGELRVYNNDMLTNLSGLESIAHIGSDLRVQHNALLSDCSVLCNLLDVDVLQGAAFVNNNPAPCSNLDQVEAICTYGSLISEIYIQNLQDTIVEGDSLIFDIVVDYAPSDTLIVNLTSNNNVEVPLPLEVMILPDSIKTTVAVDLPDDGDAEENEVVTITAGAQYLQSDSDQFVLTNDDDIPEIALEITQDTISEAAGLYATTAKVIRLGTSTEVLNITLSSSSSELNIPTGVNIFANESEKTFFIGVFDNAQVEGLRQATVTASYIIPSCVCAAPSTSEGYKTESLIIADNDGPTLELSVNPLSMEEGKENAGTLTIKRNTDTSVPLDVNVSISDATEIYLPSVVTIPAGQTQVNVPIETLNDPLEDGNQEVTISANASGFTGGDVWVIVTDINKPDLIISEVTVEQDSIDSEVLFPFNVKISNKGLSSSTQGVNLIGYLSTNSIIDANDHVIGTYFLDISVASGDTIDYPGLGASLEAPGNYKLLFRINPEQSITELLYLNNTSSPIDITIRPEYSGTVAVADSIFLIGDEIVLTGSSYNNEGVKRPNTPLEIFIYQGQVRRNIQVTTDINGDYSYTHYPLISEYGHFEVGVSYPGLGETDIQDEYDVLGVKVNNGNFIIWNLDEGDTINSGLSVRNVSEVDMQEVTLAPLNLPNGCQLVFDTLSMLGGNSISNIGYEIVAGAVTQAGVYQEFPIEVFIETTKLQQNTGYYVVNSLIGSMQASIGSISTTINQNTPKLREFTITNVGQGETGPITVSLPGNDWIRMVSSPNIPSLPSGGMATISIEFVPTDNLPLNTPASGTIAINASNANGVAIPFNVQKVSDETGGITVDVIDQFTYFTEEAPHVGGARVRISNYFTGEIFADALTGTDGTITFDSLPEGQLRIVVDAAKHKSYDGVIDVSAGASFTEVVFLEYQAISFTWDVVPTTIEDEYEIELVMNFETNAPVPVVVINVPPELPDLDDGETFAFNIVMTNQGLITAQNVQLDLPDDPEYEFMTNYEPQDILAQQTIQVPVVMKLRSGSNAQRNSEDVIKEANRRLNIKN